MIPNGPVDSAYTTTETPSEMSTPTLGRDDESLLHHTLRHIKRDLDFFFAPIAIRQTLAVTKTHHTLEPVPYFVIAFLDHFVLAVRTPHGRTPQNFHPAPLGIFFAPVFFRYCFAFVKPFWRHHTWSHAALRL